MSLRILPALLAVCAFGVLGCESEKPQAASQDGKIRISASEAQASANPDVGETFRSEEGQTLVSSIGPSEAQLGVPFYPGSMAVEKSGLTTGSPDARMYHSKRKTNVKPKQVSSWYREQVSGLDVLDEGRLLVFGTGTSRSGTIKIEDHEGGSLITIVTLETSSLPPVAEPKSKPEKK